MKLVSISYRSLNARQKENFNFQKISAILADYGFVTLRLSDDWNGADFIAIHVNNQALRVQLKSRLTFKKKYEQQDLYVAFADEGEWYLYPHDELLKKVLKATTIATTKSWKVRGGYSFPTLSTRLRALLQEYRVKGSTDPIPE